MSRILNVGIVGTGEVAQVIHLPILATMPDKYRVAALCDISEASLAYNGEKYKVDQLYTNAKELVQQSHLDVIFILNSDEYHAEVAIDAANAGKHVLIEKPMALTLADADAIIEAKNRNQVKMLVGYMRRYAPAFVAAIEEIGGMDDILYARVRDIIGPNAFFVDQSGLNPRRFADMPEVALHDRQERAEKIASEVLGEASADLGNIYRFLGGLGSHDLSVMREALGMPKAVAGATLGKKGNFLNVLFEYETFNVSYETGVDYQGRFDAHLEVYGETKSVRVEYETPYIKGLPIKLIINETIDGEFKETVRRPTYTDPYTIELIAFHKAITMGGEIKTTPEDYRNDLVIFNMIIEQLKTNLK
ncbi:putative dehydrogenase [Pullulanibacillus pueri]|uniref:Oxidoreductase n=1 Tax=Pullulanibacillus pueri TaxID=1437324 RepID=A0A8J2ZWW2_9BACL|nr:Gfo/Idh/MocA family oxidoreductase [Pullulanibacillus pueri]MBM7682644.1 putative dehydrogenase [Pullulanibacillus pueri]GGH82628.1 oxidoreductase [Pullulanibacillus pueri]